jgi:hypothetical protein
LLDQNEQKGMLIMNWTKITALLAVVAPLGVFASACAVDATALEPQSLAVAEDVTPDGRLGVSLSPLAPGAAMGCYHYYGDSPTNSNCHSFSFDNNIRYMSNNCDDGPCNPFPSNWVDWGSWGTSAGRVICKGAWTPNSWQMSYLHEVYDNAPDC